MHHLPMFAVTLKADDPTWLGDFLVSFSCSIFSFFAEVGSSFSSVSSSIPLSVDFLFLFGFSLFSSGSCSLFFSSFSFVVASMSSISSSSSSPFFVSLSESWLSFSVREKRD